MNREKDIYCELGFWRSLSSRFSNIKMTTNLDELKQNENLMDWYGLFCRSHILFDCTVADFEIAAQEDLYLKDVWKKSTDGRCLLDFSPGAVRSMCAGPSQMELAMYNSLFLTNTNHPTESCNVGIFNISSDKIYDYSKIFNDSGPSIKKDSICNWLEILKNANAQHNCSSMVIADNYIFQGVNFNLYKILDALLPQKLETQFYLTVFSLNESVESELEKKKQSLNKKIQEIRPNLSVKLEVFNSSKDDFHDRGIITNYLWIEIGAGFNIIKVNGLAGKTTNLHISYPMIIPEDRMKCSKDGYWNIIEDAKKYLKISSNISNNRLLR